MEQKSIPGALFRRILGEGEKRVLDVRLSEALKWVQAGIGIYVIAAVLFYPQQLVHRGVCLGLFAALAFIRYASPGSENRNRVPACDWLLAALSLSIGLYIVLESDRLLTRFPFADAVTPADMLFGILAILLLLEAVRRITGPWLSILSVLSLAYLSAGAGIEGLFGHAGYRSQNVIDELFMTTDGIFGSTLGVATNQIIVFILFGTFLIKSGIGNYLYDLAAMIAGRSRGGIAKTAILTSAFFGMISGSSVANASSTGTITIPMMRKNGYPASFAAALEACASVGGIFMPPVMGSVAFIMAEVAGCPYRAVALAAVIPAFLYFLAIFIAVDTKASQLQLREAAPDPARTVGAMLRKGAVYLIPLVYLIVRIMSGISPSRVGVESIAVIILVSLILKKDRIDFEKTIRALSDGVGQSIMIVTTMAACGIMIGVINLTGVSAKFSTMLLSAAGDSLPTTLIMTMLLAMFLGLAMNITPAYLLTAVVAAPVMIDLGVPLLAAHLFIVFYASMATVTPPVAMTAFAAAAIAEAPPMRVGFLAMRVGFVAYILPFAFVARPALLLQGGAIDVLVAVAAGLLAVTCFAFGLEGSCRGLRIGLLRRCLFVALGFAGLFGNSAVLAATIVLFAALTMVSGLIVSRKTVELGEMKD